MNWFKKRFCKRDRDTIDNLRNKIKALETSRKAISKGDRFLVSPIHYDNPIPIEYSEIDDIVGVKRLTLLDTHSYGIDMKDVMRILKENPEIADMNYIANDLDCDDFAIALYGLFNQQTLGRFCFGLARSKGHAFNFFIDRQKKLWIVEPQSGRIMSPAESMSQSLDYKITHYLV